MPARTTTPSSAAVRRVLAGAILGAALAAGATLAATSLTSAAPDSPGSVRTAAVPDVVGLNGAMPNAP
ncbi:hypothetical protein [Amycolatopsis sp. cg9]|uniref:hypothetical protein n=1 Tax=Amycolatopsis sp. cg9 TaxID=3238801 RepID=UPI0035260554